MKLKKLVSLVLSLAIVSSYAVQAAAAAPDGADSETQLAAPETPGNPEPDTGSQEDSGTGTPETPETPAPDADSPSLDEPPSNEPATDEPSNNEPATDEPSNNEPATDEPSNNEPATDVPPSNEPTNPAPVDDPPAYTDTETQPAANDWPVTYAAIADLTPNYRNYGSQATFGNIDIHNGNDYYQHVTTGSGVTGQRFTEFLTNDLEMFGGSQYPLPDARVSDTADNYTHFYDDNNNQVIYLPTLIGKSDMRLIGQNLNATKLSLTIHDTKGHKYTAYITQRGAQNLSSSLSTGETVNLALSFTTSMDNNRLDIKLVGANSRQGLDGDIEYKIEFEEFNDLLTPAGLKGYALTMYNGKNNKVQKPIVTVNTDAMFTLNQENGYSVYFKIWDETEYISRSEANQMIKDAIDRLEFADTADLKAQIADLENQIKKLDEKYMTEDKVNALINSYFQKETNLNALVEAIFRHEKFDDLVEKKLKEYFSVDSSDFNIFKNILIGYIISQVTTELKNLDTRLDKLETLISKAIESQLGNIFNQNTTLDSLKDFLLGLQLLGSLKGEDGKDGKDGENGKDGKDGLNGLNGRDGIDGEDFAEWAQRNYGGINNFINQISFEGWARSNYGSVDNFIRSISGTNGFSAYELAVQNGYYGSLGQWLESLRGKDGKSAYELAVENGYNGTERQWLESLHGEDGADGEDGKDGEDGRDGRDGRDGNVVYVNGTYGELPSSSNGNTAGTIQTQYPTAGAVNNDVTLTIDPPASSGSMKGAAANPSTGAAVGIFLPAAAAASVLLVKKGGRRRGRK